jgi:hypothetical protein
MKNIFLAIILFITFVHRLFGHLIQLICMYLLWNKINPIFWWSMFFILIIMYIGGKTYHTTLADGSEQDVIQFWKTTRSVIFILDIIIIIGMVTYLILF